MILTDTHAHLYAQAFNNDRAEMVQRALDAGVQYLFLPNIDLDSIAPMHALCQQFPAHCFPMMGLHPCDVKENYQEVLQQLYSRFSTNKYYAVGEIGIDYYWSRDYDREQDDAFRQQCHWALEFELPVAIHSRDSLYRTLELVKEPAFKNLRGVFHCFTGSAEQAREITGLGFYLGIGGVLTYKNTHLPDTLKGIALEDIVLETDAPYLSPVPYRGKRNESAYIKVVAEKLAELYALDISKIAEITTHNARKLFRMDS